MELPLLRRMAHLPFGHRFGTPRGSGGLRSHQPRMERHDLRVWARRRVEVPGPPEPRDGPRAI